MTLRKPYELLTDWFNATDARTWLGHAAFAALVTLLALPLFGALGLEPAYACLPVIGFYLIREGLEVLDYAASGVPVLPHWLDHVMDVAAPTASALLLARWLS